MAKRFISVVTIAGLILMSCSDDDSTGNDTVAPGVTERPASDGADLVAETPAPDTTPPEPSATEPEPDAGAPDVTQPKATEPATAEPGTERPPAHAVELLGCEQVSIYLPIDATKAQARVSADVDLTIENDRVTSLFLALECADTAVDGVSSGAAHVVAQWLPVSGPVETREGPQFEGAPVLPTAYWEPIYNATDNQSMQKLMRAAGLDMSFVEAATFERSPGTGDVHQVHLGGVTGSDPEVDFGWASPNPWIAGDEVRYGDQPTGFVHIAGDLELEAVGNIRIADVAGSQLIEADRPNEPIGDEPGQGGGIGFVTTFERIRFETID